MRIIKTLIFYTIIIIYSVEILLFFFIPEDKLSAKNIKKKRIEIAKKEGLDYDTRNPEEAFLQIKKQNSDLEPVFYYSPIFRFSQTFNKAKEENTIIPFRGPINSKSLTCAEDLKYRLIDNDKFGFKNSNSIYEKEINSMLLGDSFAEGKCEYAVNDIAGNLNKKGIFTVNFGVSGTSTLVALGIMREFGKLIKPKNFIYLYYEGNDLEGLDWEKEDQHLVSYINDDYNINYLQKYDQIQNFLKSSSSDSIAYLNFLVKKNNSKKKDSIKKFKNDLIDTVELNNIKNIVRNNLYNKKNTDYDLNFFFSIIKKMDNEAKKYNSNFLFVYVPHSSRYIDVPKYGFKKEKMGMFYKQTILEEVKKMNITVIDLSRFFDKEENVKRYYPLGYIGHFNDNGYKKISEIIANKIK